MYVWAQIYTGQYNRMNEVNFGACLNSKYIIRRDKIWNVTCNLFCHRVCGNPTVKAINPSV